MRCSLVQLTQFDPAHRHILLARRVRWRKLQNPLKGSQSFAGLLSKEKSGTQAVQNLDVVGKRLLYFSQHAITSHDLRRRAPFNSCIGKRQRQVPSFVGRVAMAPSHEFAIRRACFLRLRAEHYAMIREYRVAPIARLSPRHVTAHAIAGRGGMRFCELTRVARQAPGAVILRGPDRLVMRIMAGSTPHLPVAAPSARAQRELFGVADHP
jgi:hypothetical protein